MSKWGNTPYVLGVQHTTRVFQYGVCERVRARTSPITRFCYPGLRNNLNKAVCTFLWKRNKKKILLRIDIVTIFSDLVVKVFCK